jgi:lipopolysaccharide/colanic/teichoic acid biosynthesis glycosyltransferase
VVTGTPPLWSVEGGVSLGAPPPGYLATKRVVDIFLSLCALIALSPVLLVVAILVRVTSTGPIIYRQRRVGEGGRMFTMYKFRSMYENAGDHLHRQAYARFMRGAGGNGKVDHETLAALGGTSHLPTAMGRKPADPRITSIGAFIRKTSIDELPQLVNVLRGEMSLVGPRPPIPYEVRLYAGPHLRRLRARPGITGFWQVFGRGRVEFEKMVEMDLDYIGRRSLWLDFRLLVLTVPVVLLRRGAH